MASKKLSKSRKRIMRYSTMKACLHHGNSHQFVNITLSTFVHIYITGHRMTTNWHARKQNKELWKKPATREEAWGRLPTSPGNLQKASRTPSGASVQNFRTPEVRRKLCGDTYWGVFWNVLSSNNYEVEEEEKERGINVTIKRIILLWQCNRQSKDYLESVAEAPGANTREARHEQGRQ